MGATVGAASAASAPKAAEARSACVYAYYVRVFAYIHENPSTNSVIRDSRGAFARLNGPCRGPSGGFFEVYCSACTDGLGWVDRSKLYGPYAT